jgi:predicted nucleic acid-binding protein
MVSAKVLFDTNILIDYLNGISQAHAELERHPDRAISIVTWMEVMAGTTEIDERQIRAFLRSFRILPITLDVAEHSFTLRRQRKIKLPDAIIQATARASGRILLTRNARDFPPEEPGVSIPYVL